MFGRFKRRINKYEKLVRLLQRQKLVLWEEVDGKKVPLIGPISLYEMHLMLLWGGVDTSKWQDLVRVRGAKFGLDVIVEKEVE